MYTVSHIITLGFGLKRLSIDGRECAFRTCTLIPNALAPRPCFRCGAWCRSPAAKHMGHCARPRGRHACNLEPRGHGLEVVAGAVGPLIERAVAAGGGATGASGVKAGAVAGGRVVRRPVRVGVTVAAVGVVGVRVALRVGAGAGDLLACMCRHQNTHTTDGNGSGAGARERAGTDPCLWRVFEGGRARRWFYALARRQRIQQRILLTSQAIFVPNHSWQGGCFWAGRVFFRFSLPSGGGGRIEAALRDGAAAFCKVTSAFGI